MSQVTFAKKDDVISDVDISIYALPICALPGIGSLFPRTYHGLGLFVPGSTWDLVFLAWALPRIGSLYLRLCAWDWSLYPRLNPGLGLFIPESILWIGSL